MTDILVGDLKALKKVIDSLEKAGKLKGSDPEFVQVLESLSKKFPSGEQITAVTDRIAEDLAAARQEQNGAFQKSLASYVNELRKSGASLREGSEGWRVESLELLVDSERSRIKALYNKETVLDWRHTQSAQDIKDVYQEADHALKGAIVTDAELVFLASIERVRAYRAAQGSESPGRVPIKDVYIEVAAELLRKTLSDKRNQDKPVTVDFPMWAFLYNLDTLLASSKDYSGRKFELDTGSQAEHAKKMSVVLYGLDARTDQKQYCYIKIRD